MAFRTAYVAFPTRDGLTVAGQLRVPLTEPGAPPPQVPAVVVCHGSDGVDGRGGFHIAALNAAGIATLEVDMWAARTTVRGAAGRPSSVPQTLPDAFAALACLARQPEIDPGRIAIAGFSWGGVVSLLSATRPTPPRTPDLDRVRGPRGVLSGALGYNRAHYDLRDLTGAPVLVQAGGADAYDDPEVCDAFLGGLAPADRALVSLVVHAGATHAFDRDLPAKTITDPYAHKGKGGPVLFEFNPKAAEAARANLVAFFQKAFA